MKVKDKNMRICSSILLLFAVFSTSAALRWDNDFMHLSPEGPGRTQAESKRVNTDWKELGRKKIEEAVDRVRRIAELDHSAKNVIFIMGDGMGISTLTAARFYMAQRRNLSLEDAALSWEKMPHTALSKVYATDYQTPDSAATATAMMCGEKTSNDIIACSQDAVYNDCSSQAGTEVPSILHHAIDEGKWTGVISTARVTHASPACTYAHSVSRDWEADSDLPEDAKGVCPDIASQFIDAERNKQIRVFLGGGRENFLPNTTEDPEYTRQSGSRTDGRDLTQEWLDNLEAQDLPSHEYSYVYNQEGFDEVDPEVTQYLFGLFEPSHMQYELDRTNSTLEGDGEPSIAEMVEKAIKILQKSAQGYFLFVEGGRVDHAHHGNNAARALGDAVALSDAVQTAMDLTDEDDTLIVLTADHSHVFTMAGYSQMGTDILKYDPQTQIGDDDKPIATLAYANGPGYYAHRTCDGTLDCEISRRNQSEFVQLMENPWYVQDAASPRSSETHAGEDVAIFARGPMAHLFMGTQDQSYIGNLMMYAYCVGDNKDLCDNPPPALGCPSTNTGIKLTGLNSTFIFLLLAIFINGLRIKL